MFALRWKSLDVALNDTLDPADYSKFMAHPPIKNLWSSSRKPTLIPQMVAARAIVHAFEPADQNPIIDAKELLATWPAILQRQIVPFLNKEIDSVQDLYQVAQSGFDNSVIAASDWYARQAHGLSILVAILFAIALNIDTVAIATKLAQEPIQRATLVELAQNTVKQDQEYPTSVCPDLGTTIKPKTSIMDSRISTITFPAQPIGAHDCAAPRINVFAAVFAVAGRIVCDDLPRHCHAWQSEQDRGQSNQRKPVQRRGYVNDAGGGEPRAKSDHQQNLRRHHRDLLVVNENDNTLTHAALGSGLSCVTVDASTNHSDVCNHDTGVISMIDGNNNVIASVTIASTVQSIAVNPLTQKIYATLINSSRVVVIDAISNNVSD